MHERAKPCNIVTMMRECMQPVKARPMLTAQRKELILERLARDGQLIAKAFSEELAISEDTVRRDLRELALDGKLQRVHGGALPASAAIGDMAVREKVAPDDKLALGRAGAAMVKPGQLVIFDGG